MPLDEDEVWTQYAVDCSDALRDLEASLLALEQDLSSGAHVNQLYRGLHTLKGNSGVISLVRIERLAHGAEDLIGLVRDSGVPMDQGMVDLLLDVVDALRQVTTTAVAERRDAHDFEVAEWVERVTTAIRERRGADGATPGAVAPEDGGAAEAQGPGASMPPVGMRDPSLDPEFVAVFLSIAREGVPSVGSGIARLAMGEAVESVGTELRPALEDLHLAASRMGYLHVVDVLAELLEKLAEGGGALSSLPTLELKLYAALVGIEEEYRSLAEQPEDFAFSAIYRRACASAAFGDLARLRSLIEGPLASRQAELREIFRRLRTTCEHYGFSEGAHSCSVMEDSFSRVHEDGPPSADLLRAATQLIERLGPAIDRANAGLEVEDIQPVIASSQIATNCEVDLPISEELRRHLTLAGVTQLTKHLEEDATVLEIQAELERDAALARAFNDWLQEPDVVLLTSAVIERAQGPLGYLFLVATRDPYERIVERFRPLDSAARLFAAHRVVPGGEPLRRLPEALPWTATEGARAADGTPGGNAGHPGTPGSSVRRPSGAPGAAKPVEVRAAVEATKDAPAALEPAHARSRSLPPPSVALGRGEFERSRDGDAHLESGTKIEFLRIDARKVTAVMDLAGEIGLACGAVTHHPDLDALELEGFSAAAHKLEVLVRELQNEICGMRLVPVAGVFQRMRRVVRDTARRTGKKVELVLLGEDTEIDKVMSDSLHDPLVHMLRNAVDHGIELPEERERLGKSAVGRIVLEASHQGGDVCIEVSDDGRGLDRDRIMARARERGVLAEDARTTDGALEQLIFEPGFSTKSVVDEVSGRGVGMDVVKTTVEGLRGRLHVSSSPARGTRFALTLPLTLAFVEAMIVRERDSLFAVPIEKVLEVFKAERSQISREASSGTTYIRVRERLIPVLWLHRYYEQGGTFDETLEGRIVVVVQTATGGLALPVDALLGNQQVMLKPLRGVLSMVRAAAGCGMLRSGDVALALDCERLSA